MRSTHVLAWRRWRSGAVERRQQVTVDDRRLRLRLVSADRVGAARLAELGVSESVADARVMLK